jgi:hypothetical protein
MIEIRYKGNIIDANDVEILWTDRFGEINRGSIEEYGYDNYSEGYAESEAGEGW